MYTESELLEQFKDAFKDAVSEYVLILDDEGRYSIINSVNETMMIVEESQVANFFIGRLLEMNVKVYNSIKGIPGWGTKKHQNPVEIHPQLKELIEKMSAEEREKRRK